MDKHKLALKIKREEMDYLPRLDILIYAHDGRGLGHVSRSVAIGMALRRIAPSLRVLVVTGCKFTQELIGSVPLDWLKLPSYETEVVDGKSRGLSGNSQFSDHDLGVLRSEELRGLFQLYRPRIMLCDHSPQGKHKELKALFEIEKKFETIFILGMRGIIGEVSQVVSPLSQQLFKKHYHFLFWYGDSDILGINHIEQLRKQFACEPYECGYVSRLAELHGWHNHVPQKKSSFAGTISIPWLGEKSLDFIHTLVAALQNIGPRFGSWKIFVGFDRDNEEVIRKLFDSMGFCSLQRPSSRYAEALYDSRIALIYGGYNSLMDILHLGIPAVVILREMADQEQQLHLELLQCKLGQQLVVYNEEGASVMQLTRLLLLQLQLISPFGGEIHLGGAEIAARKLIEVRRNT